MQYIQYTVYNTYNIQDMIQYNIQDLIHTIYRIQYILYTGYNTYNIQDTIHTIQCTVYTKQRIRYKLQNICCFFMYLVSNNKWNILGLRCSFKSLIFKFLKIDVYLIFFLKIIGWSKVDCYTYFQYYEHLKNQLNQ